jgi:hypothetical protein
MLVSLILYGSRARGDHRLRSDVDLLGVIDGGKIRQEVVAQGASLYHYPAQTLLAKAEAGDLFLLHLTREGKVLHDTLGFFEQIRSRLRFSDNYDNVIIEAHAILNYLRGNLRPFDRKKVRKRYIWAMRTILIARCAEQGEACFSSAALQSFSGIEGLKSAIDGRNTIDAGDLIELGVKVSNRFGTSTIEDKWPSTLSEQKKLMLELGGVAESTLEISALFPKKGPKFKRGFVSTYE